ncbi:hypothetical protein NM688_g5894 [Phlebia brevispora]|uniref:Uncharacterized protein n=1 Tax=Phlebia brevispora TaxID=194682 RepID=A0ACC1SN29_9APHY|nr:hypothetical protein NM688_g5894 [Phlebia brevispora]
MPVITVNSLDEFHHIINQDKLALFDFWAAWCGPCKKISPVYEKLSDVTPNVEFYKINVEEQPEIIEEVSIRGMPTFMAFKSGKKMCEILGSNPENLKLLLNCDTKRFS